MSRIMMGYWTQFASNGLDPAVSDWVWPVYDNDRNTYLTLDAELDTGRFSEQSRCRFWGEHAVDLKW